jgi:methyltransferase (TIGR00027 family)
VPLRRGEPSRTALIVAGARAAHLRFDPPPHLLEDPLAERLLGEHADAMIRMHGERAPWILHENRLFMPLRARFGEDLVARAHADGVRQLVILGAGLDSYALRRPPDLSDLHVYEVDHPATQGWKQARLAALGLAVPERVSFVACDFETSSVSAALGATSFRPERPAVVIWMGVVYYLAKDTVAKALAELAGLLAPGSALALDYQLPVDALPERYREIFGQVTDYLKGVGEPQVNRYRPEELRGAALAAGFARVELPARDELQRRYLEPLGTSIPLSERFGLAIARR